MTEELKTLRQIGVRIRDKDKLRAEAIKWVKELNSKLQKGFVVSYPKDKGTTFKDMQLWSAKINAKIDWIMLFFNLTDEDLK